MVTSCSIGFGSDVDVHAPCSTPRASRRALSQKTYSHLRYSQSRGLVHARRPLGPPRQVVDFLRAVVAVVEEARGVLEVRVLVFERFPENRL